MKSFNFTVFSNLLFFFFLFQISKRKFDTLLKEEALLHTLTIGIVSYIHFTGLHLKFKCHIHVSFR